MSRSDARRKWRDVIDRWGSSGLTGAEFCRRNGIGPGQFYRWRERCRTAAVGDGDGFVPLSFRSGEAGCGVTVAMGPHVRLELAVGFDPHELARAVTALSGLARC